MRSSGSPRARPRAPRPRVRAASRHLEPDEAARRSPRRASPASRASMIARLSASVRRSWTCGGSPPGTAGGRLGAGRQQQRVVAQARRRPSSASCAPAGRCADARRRARARCVLGEESGWPERDPLLGRGAGEVVLGQVRAGRTGAVVGADQGDRRRSPRRSISAAAGPAAPPPTMTSVRRAPGVSEAGRGGRARSFSRDHRQPLRRRSTRQHGRG